jgi:hypothetical protein
MYTQIESQYTRTHAHPIQTHGNEYTHMHLHVYIQTHTYGNTCTCVHSYTSMHEHIPVYLLSPPPLPIHLAWSP